MVEEVGLDEIVLDERIRKELGDVAALANSIERLGLLHPIVILPDRRLVAGHRRLAAYRHLGRATIPANVLHSLTDFSDIFTAECEENTCRKDFTPEEAVASGLKLEIIAAELAGRRRLEGCSKGGKTAGKGRSAGKSFTKAPRDNSKRASAVVAKHVGMSHVTYERAKQVVQAAEAEPHKFGKLVEKMNRTGRVNGVYRELKVEKQAEAIRNEPPPLPAGPFRVIVADPPWRYDRRADDPSHQGGCPYPTMTVQEITALDIQRIAAEDSVLWLWTTNSFLREAFDIAKAWGFTYKTTLTWGKNRIGTGEYLRGETEHCILCVRGRPTFVVKNHSTLLLADAGRHSAKPDEFYSLVESLCPGSKIEVFSRKAREGWAGYGDEHGSAA